MEDGPFEEDLEPLVEEILLQGHNCKKIKYTPFESGKYRDLFPEDACVIFYGSINLACQLQRETPWVPGPILTKENYNFSAQVAHLEDAMLNRFCRFMPYGKLKRHLLGHQMIINDLINYYMGKEEGHGKIFIRPDSGLKTFSGQAIDTSDIKSHLMYLDTRCKPETMVVASYAKPLDLEYRLVVAGNDVISGSKYKDNNISHLEITSSNEVPDNVIKFAEYCLGLTDWRPDPIFTMDIHLSREGYYAPFDIEDKELEGMCLIELNSFSTSGLYKCDPAPTIKRASEIAVQEWRNIYEID